MKTLINKWNLTGDFNYKKARGLYGNIKSLHSELFDVVNNDDGSTTLTKSDEWELKIDLDINGCVTTCQAYEDNYKKSYQLKGNVLTDTTSPNPNEEKDFWTHNQLFDEESRIITFADEDNNEWNVFNYKIEHIYNENFDLILEKETGRDGVVESYKKYEYDNDRKLLKIIEFNFGEIDRETIYEYSINEDLKKSYVIQKKSYINAGRAPDIFTDTFKYDVVNNIINKDVHFNNQCTYDSVGNCIKEIDIENNQIITTSYEYYDE